MDGSGGDWCAGEGRGMDDGDSVRGCAKEGKVVWYNLAEANFQLYPCVRTYLKAAFDHVPAKRSLKEIKFCGENEWVMYWVGVGGPIIQLRNVE